MRKNGKTISWFNLLLLTSGAASAVLGLVVLISSYTQSVKLLEALQALAPMPYNAALGFILCGGGLLSIAFGRPRLAVAAGAAAIAGLFFLYYGIDQPDVQQLVDAQIPFYQASLIVGLLMALLLALALYYAQVAWSRAEEAEAFSRELQRQMAERRQAEEALKASQGAARDNMKRLRALHEIEMAVGSTLDLRKVLELLLEKIGLHMPYAAATVCLVNRDTGRLEPVAYRNFSARYCEADEWKPTCALCARSLDVRTPTIITDLQSDFRTQGHDLFRKHGLFSYAGIPLVAKSEFLGSLGFYTGERRQFANDEIEFLMTVAGQGATAIQNSQLYCEMKGLAGELVRSNKVKDEFLSVMSHEMRTPLHTVVGYAGMVKDGMFGEVNPEQKNALEKMMSRAKDQITLINSILEATRIEVEGTKIECQEFCLAEFLDDLSSGYDVPSGGRLTLRWEYPPDLPIVETDRQKLSRILQNIIDNAVKFTEKGSVSISARYFPLAKSVEFRVADTGIGIPQDSQSIIFELFRQVDSSETREYGGVGLGLYIAKKFTDLLGGNIWVESAPGKGSTFYVRLPLAARASGRSLKAA